MGYTAYITRDRSYPFLASDPPNSVLAIAVDEWLRLVESDTELIPAGERAAQWRGHELPFEYQPETKSICHHDPQPNVIEKMLRLATTLNAVVRGGDGEIYTTGTEFHWPERPDFETQRTSLPASKPMAYLPSVAGFIAMLTFDQLFDSLLITLGAGAAAVLITALLLVVPSLWQRTA
ncbi:MAG: hypothetical protein KDA87_26480 [Planctomycetales bacterium]|nr:hypothetical protein [Planctomycetales bacterium]